MAPIKHFINARTIDAKDPGALNILIRFESCSPLLSVPDPAPWIEPQKSLPARFSIAALQDFFRML